MKTRNLAAAAILLATPAPAQTLLPAAADTPPAVARVRAPPQALSVHNTVEFSPGATIDFSDMTQHQPGPLRGYIYVRMQGELVLVPVYRPMDDGTIWRLPPAQH